jgi:hypothetical protein
VCSWLLQLPYTHVGWSRCMVLTWNCATRLSCATSYFQVALWWCSTRGYARCWVLAGMCSWINCIGCTPMLGDQGASLSHAPAGHLTGYAAVQLQVMQLQVMQLQIMQLQVMLTKPQRGFVVHQTSMPGECPVLSQPAITCRQTVATPCTPAVCVGQGGGCRAGGWHQGLLCSCFSSSSNSNSCCCNNRVKVGEGHCVRMCG